MPARGTGRGESARAPGHPWLAKRATLADGAGGGGGRRGDSPSPDGVDGSVTRRPRTRPGRGPGTPSSPRPTHVVSSCVRVRALGFAVHSAPPRGAALGSDGLCPTPAPRTPAQGGICGSADAGPSSDPVMPGEKPHEPRSPRARGGLALGEGSAWAEGASARPLARSGVCSPAFPQTASPGGRRPRLATGLPGSGGPLLPSSRPVPLGRTCPQGLGTLMLETAQYNLRHNRDINNTSFSVKTFFLYYF